MKKRYLIYVMLFIAGSTAAQTVLTLEDCRQMALNHNKTLQIAQENVKAANELKRAAFTQFFPNFSANGTYTWNEKNLSLLSEDKYLPVYNMSANGTPNYAGSWNNSWTMVNGSPVPLDASGAPFNPKANPEKIMWKNYALLPKSELEFDVQNIFAGSVGFVQPLFMGGKIAELYKIAKYGENLAQAQKENKEHELMIEVDEAYWRVVSLENKIKLAKEYRSLIARVEENVKVMIEEGVATKAEALKVRVKLNEADVSVAKAENGLSLSRMALNQLCGLALETVYTLNDGNLEQKAVEPQLIPIEQALQNRPEVSALTQLENIAKSNEKLMLSRFLPTVALSGNYLVTNPNVYNGYENDFGGMFSVGVVAHVPLFHFGDKIHTLNAAKAQSRIATMQLEETKEKMQLQIKQTSYKMAESLKKQKTTQDNVEQAVENLKYATDGFEEGVISSTDLLAAQTAWLSAKSDNIDALIEVRLCDLYLQKSQGTLRTPTISTLDQQKSVKK